MSKALCKSCYKELMHNYTHCFDCGKKLVQNQIEQQKNNTLKLQNLIDLYNIDVIRANNVAPNWLWQRKRFREHECLMDLLRYRNKQIQNLKIEQADLQKYIDKNIKTLDLIYKAENPTVDKP